MRPRSKKQFAARLRAFALELVIYAALVTGYFFARSAFSRRLAGATRDPAHSGLRRRRILLIHRTSRCPRSCYDWAACDSCAEVAPNNVFPDLALAH